MDQRLKTALAVAIGVVIGMTLLGTAVAIPAVFRAAGHRAAVVESGSSMMGRNADEFGGQGMMGQRGMMRDQGQDVAGQRGMMRDQGRGMMDRRGQAPSVNGERVCPNGESGLQQDGTVVCPNGGTCPNVTTPETLPQS